MRRYAKASSAGSTSGRDGSIDSLRRVFAVNGAFLRVHGGSASAQIHASRSCLALLAITAAALLFPVANATAATVAITLTGSGGGTITSANPGGINCTLSGGVSSGTCNIVVPDDFSSIPTDIIATPASGSVFGGWTVGDGTCTSSTNPCQLPFTHFSTPYSITASFIPTPDLPLATTDPQSTGLTIGLTTLNGRVNPNGTALTDCRFVYGTTTDYGESAPCDQSLASLGTGTADSAVSASTAPLEPSTVYHYRLRASNLGGTVQGKDRTLTTGPAPADNCPNADIRAQQGINTLLLPDCMALEMVSPPKKGQQFAANPHVSPDGERILFNSIASLGDTQLHYSAFGDSYVATRNPSGWTTGGTNAPPPFYSANAPDFFAPDFSRWIYTQLATLTQFSQGNNQVYQGSLSGNIFPLSPVVIHPDAGNVNAQSVGLGATTDLSHFYFKPKEYGSGFDRGATYLPGDPKPAGAGEDANVYVAQLDSSGNPTLALLARDKDGKAWGANCGARLGGAEKAGPNTNLVNGSRTQGAVSSDGSRVYFSTRPSQPATGNCTDANKKRIMVREETPTGPVISELIVNECDRISPPCAPLDGDDVYQGASVDLTKVYFNTTRQLTDTDFDGTAAGTGNTTGTGSSTVRRTITGVVTTSGTFTVGMQISGAGIPANTTITAVNTGAGTLTISQNATATASGVTLAATSPGCSGAIAIAGCDLYLYDSTKPAGQRLTQVSAGEGTAATPGIGANVQNSITAISADGSHVYFVARTILTTDPSPVGAVAQSNQNNLYLYTPGDDDLAFIGVLAANDVSNSAGSSGLFGGGGTANWATQAYSVPIAGQDTQGNEVGGDGHILLLNSRAALTADDADTLHDIYRYDAEAGTLERVSKAMSGGVDNGSFSASIEILPPTLVPGPDYAERFRWVSEDGETVVFRTAEALLAGDNNSAEDVYMWREGQLFRLPGSAGAARGVYATLSHDGNTVAYQSVRQLLPADGDTVDDVYVARVGGGYLHVTPTPCVPDARGGCQGAAATALDDLGPAFAGVGNLTAQDGPNKTRCPKGKRKVTRKSKVRCVSRKAKKSMKHSRANANRRAAK